MRGPKGEASRWVGRILRDKWRLDARIARGGVGTVYAATHRNNGATVAIKVLHPDLSRDADTRSRFLQEGYAANQVNHPGVVRILDDDVTEEGMAFLVMELLEGELLEERRIRNGGRLPLDEVYEVADQLLDVLAAAHDQGIVHRDIKPDNLFLTNDGRLKILDFGFAQMKRGFRREQTATGYLLGTPGFMPPEQAIGDRTQVDAQTDIWAVGATLFTLLSGAPVHEADSAAEMLFAAANYHARPLSSVEPSVPSRLGRIVDKALSFDKSARWADARTMQGALRAASGRTPEPADEDDDPFAEETVMERIEQLDESAFEAEPSWDEDRTISDPVGRASIPEPPPSRPEPERTLIMESPARAFGPARPPAAPPARAPLGSGFLSTPLPFVAPDPSLLPRPAPPPPARALTPTAARALSFLAVTVVSMVVVVAVGLAIFAATD